MQIHQLSVAKRKKRKLIGRGGKRGTTAGRGTKGQKARSGSSVDPLFEGGRSTFLERLKKVRGFKSIHPKRYIVTLEKLSQVYADGETVTVATLIAKHMVPAKAAVTGVKVLATGKLTKKLSLGKDVAASGQAKAAFQTVEA